MFAYKYLHLFTSIIFGVLFSRRGWVPRRLGGGIGGNKNSGQLRFGGITRPFCYQGIHRTYYLFTLPCSSHLYV